MAAKHLPEKRRRRQIFRQDDSGGKASTSKAQDHSGVASARDDHKRRHNMANMQQEGTDRGGRRPRSDHQPQRPSNAKAPERRVVPTGQTGASCPRRRRQSQQNANNAAHQGAPAAVPVTGAEAPRQGQAQEATPDRRPATTDTSLWRGVATVAPARWRTLTGCRRNRVTPKQIQPGGGRIRRRDARIWPPVTTAGDQKRRQCLQVGRGRRKEREGSRRAGPVSGEPRAAAAARPAAASTTGCGLWEGSGGRAKNRPRVA